MDAPDTGRNRVITSMDIHKADPAQRRKLILIILIALGIALCLFAIYEMLIPWSMDDIDDAVFRIHVLIACLFIAAIPILYIARLVWKTGEEVIRTGRYPPPGMKVVRDTEVITGREAQQRGRQLQRLAIIYALLASLPPIVLWVLISIIIRSLLS